MKRHLLTVLAATLLSSLCPAQRDVPASLLVMPEFDNRAGVKTILTVTNTHPTQGVLVMFEYVDDQTCNRFNRVEDLGPNDTLTLLTSHHNPYTDQGFVYVHAVDVGGPLLYRSISFNWLIGHCQTLNGLEVFEHGVEPFAFRAIAAEGNPTDFDLDGTLDLNGVEYEPAPEYLLFPRFLADPFFLNENKLILINLTGSEDYTATVELLIYNDNMEFFSAAYSFQCWEKRPLTDISPIFGRSYLASFTNHDPTEIFGLTSQEAGWFSLHGAAASSTYLTVPEAAILAVLVEDDLLAGAAVLPFSVGQHRTGGLLHRATPIEPEGFCFGVGCPCGNDSSQPFREGCENRTGDGAYLLPVGNAWVTSQFFRLQVRQAPPGELGIFIQNTTLGAGTHAFDGRLCLPTDSHLVRHYAPPAIQPTLTDAAGTGVNAQSFPQGDFLGDTQAGRTLYYQFWYRDSFGPCGNGANFSSGLAVTWAP